MALIASGAITITDLNDAPVLHAYITANKATTQIYNELTATYSPSRASDNMTLQLNLVKAGSSTSLLGSAVPDVTWKKRVGATETAVTGSGTSKGTVTVSTNEGVDNGGVRYTVTGTWTDPVTTLAVPFTAYLDLPVVKAGSAASYVVALTPNGDTFRNNTPSTLTAEASLFRGGTKDAGAKGVRWFYQDSTATTTSGGHSDGGEGWRLVSGTANTADAYVSVAPGDSITAETVTLTVKPALVVNARAVKVVITRDGQKYPYVLTFRDMDDPIWCDVFSAEGEVFKNGQTDTSQKKNLLAKLYRLGQEIDPYVSDSAATTYSYKWVKYDRNGTMSVVKAAGKTGANKKLQVSTTDVTGTAQYICEIEE